MEDVDYRDIFYEEREEEFYNFYRFVLALFSIDRGLGFSLVFLNRRVFVNIVVIIFREI